MRQGGMSIGNFHAYPSTTSFKNFQHFLKEISF